MELRKNTEASRYELLLDGQLASFVDYIERGEVVALVHTETPPAFQGRGLAAQVVDFALDDIAAQEKKVKPSCPFAAHRLSKRSGEKPESS